MALQEQRLLFQTLQSQYMICGLSINMVLEEGYLLEDLERLKEVDVGGISVSFYGADVRSVYWVSQWRRMTQGCGSHVASSRM